MSTLPQHLDELIDLVDAQLRNRLTEAQAARLEELLREPEARAVYAELLMDAASLRKWAGGSRKPTDALEPIVEPVAEPSTRRLRFAMPLSIAAALLAACGLAAYLLTASVDPEPVDPPNQPGPSVATLIQNTGDLRTPHGYPAEGSDYAAGEYALDRGSAEFMLTNSVNVKLRGSTRMVMHNDMHVALIRGTATFRCPPAAKGFVVDLPGDARVTDLGTEFAVRTLDSGAREVYVIDGLVELAADDGSVQYLVEGEGYRIDFDGAVAALTRPAILDTFGSIALSGDAYQQMVLDEEPVAYWPMASGDQRIIDLVTDQTADAHGTRFDTQGPHNDAAVAFDGSAFVDLGQRPDLLIPGPMTVEAWVWIDPNIKLHGRIISFDGMQGGGWALGYTPVSDTKHKPGVVFTMLGVADYPFADARIEHGRWTHLAITLSASRELTLYFDGQPVGTQSGIVDFAMPRSPRAFLGQQSPAVVPLVGRLAHVAVYDHVLEPSLLRSRYSALKQETPRPHVKELSK